jgi:hypothetical protein
LAPDERAVARAYLVSLFDSPNSTLAGLRGTIIASNRRLAETMRLAPAKLFAQMAVEFLDTETRLRQALR